MPILIRLLTMLRLSSSRSVLGRSSGRTSLNIKKSSSERLKADVMNYREVRRVKELKLLVLSSVSAQSGQVNIMIVVTCLDDIVDELGGQGCEGRM